MARLFYVTFDESTIAVRDIGRGAHWSDKPILAYDARTQRVAGFGAAVEHAAGQGIAVTNPVREGGIGSDAGHLLLRHAVREALRAGGVRLFGMRPDMVLHPLDTSAASVDDDATLVRAARSAGARRIAIARGRPLSDGEVTELAARRR